MCWEWIKGLFKKEEPPIQPEEPLGLPHPEEPVNYDITIDNFDLSEVFNKWMNDWFVPQEYRDIWLTKMGNITVTLEIINYQVVPAWTWEENGERYMKVRPEWLNPGVIAHEQAHNSYALLTEEQKTAFSAAYTPLKDTDPMIKYLYSINSYGLQNDIEGHAEVYRYIGEQMPGELKQFYPKLF
jgi:hypothetical protein